MQKPDFKSPGRILRQLVDIVAKNGNLLLSVGPRADGTMPEGVQSRLLTIGAWLSKNGEAIYGTRPWHVFGEGPNRIQEGQYIADHIQDFGPEDIRFTRSRNALYITFMAPPMAGAHTVCSIRRPGPLPVAQLSRIVSVADGSTVQWRWREEQLEIFVPHLPGGDLPWVIRLES
jgi:alpha-L-fucosidase